VLSTDTDNNIVIIPATTNFLDKPKENTFVRIEPHA
jgi:hypothetical protein